MDRIKSIDTFRGLSMLWMFVAHLLNWWLITEDAWLYDLMWAICDVMGAGAFLFISGVSTTIAYRNRQIKEVKSGMYNKRMTRNQFLFRGLFIFLVALLYNLPVAIYTQNPFNLWIWYILLTIGVSVLLSWPLLKINKFYRMFIAVSIIILNQILIGILIPYENKNNTLGILFHILYNGFPALDPIILFFPFFLIGTAIGDGIFDIYRHEQESYRKKALKNQYLFPSLIVGTFFITFGILYQFPLFLSSRTFPWTWYSLGIQLIFLSVLISLEELKFKKVQKSYKFLFYFSYYSLTIFIAHNLLFFIFLKELSASIIFFFIFGTITFVALLLRYVYKKLGRFVSLKVLISVISTELAKKIESLFPSIK
ncbi:MAG: heparan-alpha-glucosaminide N-acetyltransferase domain-containing protein [Promethearchaeota archaeon]